MSNQGKINGSGLDNVAEQNDLGIRGRGSLKVVIQMDSVVKKALGTLAVVGQGIELKSWHIMMPLCKLLVDQTCNTVKF